MKPTKVDIHTQQYRQKTNDHTGNLSLNLARILTHRAIEKFGSIEKMSQDTGYDTMFLTKCLKYPGNESLINIVRICRALNIDIVNLQLWKNDSREDIKASNRRMKRIRGLNEED